jgi:nucleoside diphosphate kinase
MTLLKELLPEQQVGLTVYLPDCAPSRLWGHLDQAIHEATGFQIVRRVWIRHDINSILRFYQRPGDEPPAEQDPAEARVKYDNIPSEILQYGHLMVKLLMQGPSLLTLWRGENVIPTLLDLKGKTQPAEAAAHTLRGRFWCDNGVCNLVHSSDDPAEFRRELAAVRLEHWLDEEIGFAPLLQPGPTPAGYVAHSGIIVATEVVNRLLSINHQPLIPIQLPPSGNAQETNQQFTQLLREAAGRYGSVAPFIEAFLTGHIVTVTHLLQSLPVTQWEHFVIQCGAINRDSWNKVL